MNALFFELENNKQLKRQIRMLKYLSNIQEPVSLQDLTMYIGCSKPTALSDISLLNNDLPPDTQIKKKGNDIFLAKYNEGVAIDYHITRIMQETLVFQIIDNIFHNRIYSFQRTMDDLFVSKAVLRKTINHMNRVLKDFKISISTKQIDFIGDEANIRLFLFHFYSCFRNYFITHDANNIQTRAVQYLLQSVQDANVTHLHINYFRTIAWVIILTERILQGHFVSVQKKLLEETLVDTNFQRFHSLLKEINQKYYKSVYFSLDELVWLYMSSLYCVSYSTFDNEKLENANISYNRNTSLEVVEKIDHFLEPVFSKEMLANGSVDKIKAYIINLSLLSKLTPVFQYFTSSLKQSIKETQYDRYMLWYELLQKNSKGFLFPIKYMEDVAVSLTILHASIIKTQTIKPIRVLLSFNGELGYEDILYHKCKMLFTDNVQIEYLVTKAITRDILESLKIDLVVCNYELPELISSPCEIIRLSYIPERIEWSLLRNKIINFYT